MQSSGPMVSIYTAVAALLLGIGLSAARADTNAEAFVAHQAAMQTFEADLRQVFHWSFPRKHAQLLRSRIACLNGGLRLQFAWRSYRRETKT